jgi:multicomponent Na+:H+ antiporter subunit D
VADRPGAAAAADTDAALTTDGSGSGADETGADAPVDAAPPSVSMQARLIVVAAAVAAVVIGVFATDLIAVFEPVLEVSFQ